MIKLKIADWNRFMSIDNLFSQIKSEVSGEKKLPPVELWNPDFCGDIDLVIKADGTWFYLGTPFKRMSLVQLFASVLKKEHDKYYLVTPVEKIGITVEDAPFVLTQWRWKDDTNNTMIVTTNVGDEFELNAQHPLTIAADGSLYVVVRRNLTAKVHRNVYYQWIDLATEIKNENGTKLVFFSAEHGFVLGEL